MLAAIVPWVVIGVGRQAGIEGTTLALGSVGVGIGAAIGVTQWITFRRIRQGFRRLASGLTAGGVDVDRIDYLGGIVRLRYRLHTGVGSIGLRIAAHPWGRVTPELDTVERGRLPGLSDWGRSIAHTLRG